MALSLRQKAAVQSQPNARERIRMAILQVADQISAEQPEEGATEDEIALVSSRKVFARSLMGFAVNWIDQFYMRIINKPAVVAVATSLAFDSNLVNAETEVAIDAVLIAAIESVFDELIPPTS